MSDWQAKSDRHVKMNCLVKSGGEEGAMHDVMFLEYWSITAMLRMSRSGTRRTAKTTHATSLSSRFVLSWPLWRYMEFCGCCPKS